MSQPTEHIDDVRNIAEGDTVTITTSEGHHFEAECVSREEERADPRSGEIRRTKIWEFSAVEWRPVAVILDGLRSSPDDPQFPQHSSLTCQDTEQDLGFITDLQIHGPTTC